MTVLSLKHAEGLNRAQWANWEAKARSMLTIRGDRPQKRNTVLRMVKERLLKAHAGQILWNGIVPGRGKKDGGLVIGVLAPCPGLPAGWLNAYVYRFPRRDPCTYRIIQLPMLSRHASARIRQHTPDILNEVKRGLGDWLIAMTDLGAHPTELDTGLSLITDSGVGPLEWNEELNAMVMTTWLSDNAHPPIWADKIRQRRKDGFCVIKGKR